MTLKALFGYLKDVKNTHQVTYCSCSINFSGILKFPFRFMAYQYNALDIRFVVVESNKKILRNLEMFCRTVKSPGYPTPYESG